MEQDNENDNLPEAQGSHLRINHRDQAHASGQIKWAVAEGYLDIDEAEQRLERIYQATTRGELQPATADLPVAQPPPPEKPLPVAAATSTAAGNRVLSLLSSSSRTGGFDFGQPIQATAVLGDVTIDLSTIDIPEHGVDVQVQSIFGDVKLILPDGAQVEHAGFAVLGDRSEKLVEPATGGPRVRINSTVVFGDFKVYSLSRTPKKVLRRAWKRITGL